MGVMNVKGGTKSFGETRASETINNNLPNTLSAQDKEKMGGENVGEVANKLADPNWIDPSKKTRHAGNPSLDKDAFFKLMLAQMKNQDPTNPLKSHEMAAQLANFSSLEQMQNMNTTLTEMKNGQKPAENFQALNLIGKAVAGDAANVVRANGDKDHDFKFTLPMDAGEATIRVRNPEGETVRTYNLKNLKMGDNKISWNGEDEQGNKLPPGEFNFFMDAKDSAGKKIAVKTAFDGVITGVNYTQEGPVLLIGNQTIRLRDVKKITDPSLMKNDQIVKDVTSLDLKKEAVAGDTNKEGSEESKAATGHQPKPAMPSGPRIASGADVKEDSASTGTVPAKSKIMDSVGLSRGMINKLAKETAK